MADFHALTVGAKTAQKTADHNEKLVVDEGNYHSLLVLFVFGLIEPAERIVAEQAVVPRAALKKFRKQS